LYIISRILERLKPGDYLLIILDAWYRALPQGISENDNEDITRLYNLIDSITDRLQAAWVNVHHATKGNQSEKRVTDVGSGAGAQSRCADSHIVLRAHQEENAVVLEAAVRSFAPVEPLPLRWVFPIWRPADELDPTKLQGRQTANEQRQNENDLEGIGKLSALLMEKPSWPREIERRTGYGREKVRRLLNILESKGKITSEKKKIDGQKCNVYSMVKETTDEQAKDPF
jgi:hypothetical protein